MERYIAGTLIYSFSNDRCTYGLPAIIGSSWFMLFNHWVWKWIWKCSNNIPLSPERCSVAHVFLTFIVCLMKTYSTYIVYSSRLDSTWWQPRLQLLHWWSYQSFKCFCTFFMLTIIISQCSQSYRAQAEGTGQCSDCKRCAVKQRVGGDCG